MYGKNWLCSYSIASVMLIVQCLFLKQHRNNSSSYKSDFFFLNLTNTFGFLNIYLKNEFLCTSVVIRCHKIRCLKVCII